MKPNLTNFWQMNGRIIGMVVAVLVLCSFSVPAQDPKPEPGAPEAKEGGRKGSKAAGPAEPADGVGRGAKALPAQADRPEKDLSAKGRAMDKREIELKRELLKAREAVRELRESGKEVEADEVERRVQNLEAELARREGNRGEVFEWRGPRPPGEGPQVPPEKAELERRLRHLKVAVDNLHAAGMHEPADMIARESDRMRREFAADERGGLRGPMPPGPGIERLQAELQELRQTVEDLRARVEALSKERR
jgi:DNA repair exonuclease SbcCD ATPase subunit